MNHPASVHDDTLDLLLEAHEHLTLEGLTPISGYVFLQLVSIAVNVIFSALPLDEAANTFCENVTDFYPQSLSM